MYQQHLNSERESEIFAEQLALRLQAPLLITLRGDLGAGKTTIVRALLRALGITSAIKSPTYALVEFYETKIGHFLHFDLYRLSEAEELEYIGIRDYLSERAICCIEWPERADGLLPAADLEIRLTRLPQGRDLQIYAHTAQGKSILNDFAML